MKAHPLLYQGRMVYPLKDSAARITLCSECMFLDEDGGEKCGKFSEVMHNDQRGANCVGVHWAEGEAAQIQYTKERLTS